MWVFRREKNWPTLSGAPPHKALGTPQSCDTAGQASKSEPPKLATHQNTKTAKQQVSFLCSTDGYTGTGNSALKCQIAWGVCGVFWTSGQTHRPTSRNWRWREVLHMETRKLGLNLCINFGSYSQFPLFKSRHSSTLECTPSEAPKTQH